MERVLHHLLESTVGSSGKLLVGRSRLKENGRGRWDWTATSVTWESQITVNVADWKRWSKGQTVGDLHGRFRDPKGASKQFPFVRKPMGRRR